jgi:thiopurine S-methyltransferase
MKADFWHERWESGQLGFHQFEPDRILTTYWPRMGVVPGGKVFVPLCGKSLDMLWLREQGHVVAGVELSARAVADFVEENDLDASVEQRGAYEVTRADGIEIWCGDFFALPGEATAGVAAVYDRGSMVALPPEMREPYTVRLRQILGPAPIFLSCVEYDQSEMAGPPFSVTAEEIALRYGDGYEIVPVFEEWQSDVPEKFRMRGLTAIKDHAFIVRPRH